jgi:hypothetical protein
MTDSECNTESKFVSTACTGSSATRLRLTAAARAGLCRLLGPLDLKIVSSSRRRMQVLLGRSALEGSPLAAFICGWYIRHNWLPVGAPGYLWDSRWGAGNDGTTLRYSGGGAATLGATTAPERRRRCDRRVCQWCLHSKIQCLNSSSFQSRSHRPVTRQGKA